MSGTRPVVPGAILDGRPMPQVRISIVTPSFQQAAHLGACLDSVRQQEGEVEHIVVDGGSTDGSKAVIERHAADLAWWCSGPDAGQSAAINKGLAHATGTVFNWLNSDDALLPHALRHVAEAFAADPGLLAFGGQRRVIPADGMGTVQRIDDPAEHDALFIRPQVNQQSTFYRLDAVRAIGGVEEKLQYAMDYELWLQLLFRHGTSRLRFDPVPLAVFNLRSESKTGTGRWAFANEIAGVLHGLCMATGNQALATVLAMGHTLPVGLRAIPAGREHAPLVRRMAVHFLLKWYHAVFNERQFHMMRALCEAVPLEKEDLAPDEVQWHAMLKAQLAVPGWWAFRLRRKWRHLTA